MLILDEPASALDPRARVELRALLKELARMGKTIIISSHILTGLSALCTSVAIIEKGRLAESGDIEEIRKRRHGVQWVRIHLAAPYPRLDALLAGSPDVGQAHVEGSEVLFEYRGAPDAFHRVVKTLTDNEVPLLSIHQEAKDLERLFMELTEDGLQ